MTCLSQVALNHVAYSFTELCKSLHHESVKIHEEGISDHITWILRNLYVGEKQNWTRNSGLVQNWEKSKTRLYTVTLFI